MKTLQFLLLIVLGATLHTNAFSQAHKMDGALNSFLNSEFMLRARDLKIEAETTVKTFKMDQHKLKLQDIKKVEIGYDQTAYRFNQMLNNIKADFLNPKKLKYISKFPESYLKGLELELYQLSDFYAQNFLQPLADAQANQVDGSATLLIITELMGLTKGLFNYFGQMQREARHYNESYLQQHLIQGYRFRYWNEIHGGDAIDPAIDPTYDPLNDNTVDFPTNELPDIIPPSLLNDNSIDPNEDPSTYDDYLNQTTEEENFDPIDPNENIEEDPILTPQTEVNDSTSTSYRKLAPPRKGKSTPTQLSRKKKTKIN